MSAHTEERVYDAEVVEGPHAVVAQPKETQVDILRVIERRNELLDKIKSYALKATHSGHWSAQGDKPFTAQALAKPLGFKDARSVLRLFKRNAVEFPAAEVAVVRLTTPGGTQEAHAFSAVAAHLLGMLAATDEGVVFRRWLLETFIRPFLSGARVVPADRLAALEAALAALLEDRKADRKLIEQLGALAATSIGHAGKMLSTFARSPEAKAYRDARIREDKDRRLLERKNRILPLLDGTNGNGSHGAHAGGKE